MKEIRDLLEKAKIILRTKSEIHRPEPLVKPSWKCLKDADYTDLEIIIYQALALLSQPKCSTCGDTGEIEQNVPMAMSGSVSSVPDILHIPCPDCQQPKDQPSSEFIKECYYFLGKRPIAARAIIENHLTEACRRLDTSESSRRELLDACESVKRYNEAAKEGKINPDEDGDYWEVVMDDIEAAITNEERIDQCQKVKKSKKR